MDATPRTTAFASPGVHLELPGRREEGARVGRVHHNVDRAGVLVHEQHALPGLAAVLRAIDAALGLRAVTVALRGDEDDVGIGRVDHDAADAAGRFETHVRPCAAGVRRLVDAIPDRDVAPDERLT